MDSWTQKRLFPCVRFVDGVFHSTNHSFNDRVCIYRPSRSSSLDNHEIHERVMSEFIQHICSTTKRSFVRWIFHESLFSFGSTNVRFHVGGIRGNFMREFVFWFGIPVRSGSFGSWTFVRS